MLRCAEVCIGVLRCAEVCGCLATHLPGARGTRTGGCLLGGLAGWYRARSVRGTGGGPRRGGTRPVHRDPFHRDPGRGRGAGWREHCTRAWMSRTDSDASRGEHCTGYRMLSRGGSVERTTGH